MNAQNRAHAAYASPVAAYRSARDTEYQLLARVTARLHHAMQDGDAHFASLAAALNQNRQIWVTFAIDLAGPGNALPDGLRTQLLGLAQFVIDETDSVLGGQAKPDALIDINLSIMRGLKGFGDTGAMVTT
jgi:flagellar protein FlaF